MQYLKGFADKNSPQNAAKLEKLDWHGGEPAPDQKGLLGLLDGMSILDGRMRMLVRRDGTFLAGSSGLAESFEMGTCLVLHEGVVRATRLEYGDRLKDLLKVRAPKILTLALPCWTINGHLIIRATSICKTVVCFSLQQATEMVEPELADLEDVFGLTKSEAVIVYDLFLGHTPQQIAEEHNNSIHTVRAHIRRCYDKLGITCREELWRKLNAYRLT